MRPSPEPGIVVQPWLGAIRGDRNSELARFCVQAKAAGCTQLLAHGFPRGMVKDWRVLSDIISREGLSPMAAFGLDGKKDNDGGPLTAREKGQCVGTVAQQLSCAAVYLDAEGQWDSDQGESDDMDERGALEFGEELRKLAPTAVVCDQLWPIIDVHGDPRRSAIPMFSGDTKNLNVFRGFPVDEFAASCVNDQRARQFYWANWHRQWGKDAYEKLAAWMERSWAVVRPSLEAKGLARTEAVTVQMYGHEESNIDDLVNCMIDWAWNRQTRVIGWAEPFPSALCMAAMGFAYKMHKLGFAQQGVPPMTAIRAFQTSTRGALVADGVAGPKTLRYAGFTW